MNKNPIIGDKSIVTRLKMGWKKCIFYLSKYLYDWHQKELFFTSLIYTNNFFSVVFLNEILRHFLFTFFLSHWFAFFLFKQNAVFILVSNVYKDRVGLGFFLSNATNYYVGKSFPKPPLPKSSPFSDYIWVKVEMRVTWVWHACFFSDATWVIVCNYICEWNLLLRGIFFAFHIHQKG